MERKKILFLLEKINKKDKKFFLQTQSKQRRANEGTGRKLVIIFSLTCGDGSFLNTCRSLACRAQPVEISLLNLNLASA